MTVISRPPVPPFSEKSATQKVRLAEDAWNSRDPARVVLAYSVESRWRNRSEFIDGRPAIAAFLKQKWDRELDYRLIRSCGLSVIIVSQCVSPMNGTTLWTIGSAVTEMRIGNSIRTDEWSDEWPASTTCQFSKVSVNFTGRLGDVPMNIWG